MRNRPHARRLLGRVREGVTRYGAVVHRREPALLLGAGFVSEIGDWFNTVALIALAYRIGDGSLGVGLMLALRMVPRLLFQGPAGSLVDRWSGRRLLVVSHLLMAIIAAAFIALEAIPEIWLLAVLVLALETVNTVAWPAFRVQLTKETEPTQYAAVNGLLSIGLTAAQFIGPVLGGLVLVWLGAGPVFLLNGVTFAVVALAVLQLGLGEEAPAPPPAEPVAPAEALPTVQQGGYRWLLRRRDLMLFALAALGVTITIRGAIALFVVRSYDFGLGDAGPGYFYAAVALGAIVGGLIAGAGSHTTPTSLGVAAGAIMLCAVALTGFGVAPGPTLAVGALVVAGLATNVYEVLGMTFFQHRLPAEVYGRFMAIFLVALGGGGLIGALVGPLLDQAMSVGAALTILAAPAVLAAAALLLRPLREDRDPVEAAPPPELT